MTDNDGHIRCSGAGRKQAEETYPDIIRSVQEILDDETYGSPEGGKWTSCSLRNISKALADMGITVEKSTVQRIVKELGYSRQKNTTEVVYLILKYLNKVGNNGY